MVDATPSAKAFAELGLPTSLLDTLIRLGYEQATPIQSGTIPPLLAGRDVVGIAQTGTGKTAAFALPIIADITLSNRRPQALVLCPTRELSLQVADAFRSYAGNVEGLRVLAICGGADMRQQLRSLRDGVHVVVATPGRMLDHIQRGSIDLSHVTSAVLDEADEMLRMGFIDDVDAILAKTPSERRVALFSATMPPRIRQIAQRHLKDPIEIAVSAASSTNVNIEQFYWLAKGASKVEALKRLLAYEETDGVIVFTRTRESTSAVAEHLSQAGYRATALHGDMDQKARVRTVEQLKNGQLDVLVATDVAARGLDVDRITHVINFDIPFDEEAYVHRIGRTGRAGRNGKAILFVSPRERRMLRNIERLTKNSIPAMELPSLGAIALKQRELFAANLREQLTKAPQIHAEQLVDTLANEHNGDYRGLAAQLLGLLAEQKGLALEPAKVRKQETPFATATSAYPMTDSSEASSSPQKRKARQANRSSDDGTDKQPRKRGAEDSDKGQLGRALPLKNHPDILMERFRLAVGKRHGVEIREIVGAIANEAGIEGQYIGTVNIQQEFSTVDLPEGMPKEILQHLKKTRVKGNPLGIARI